MPPQPAHDAESASSLHAGEAYDAARHFDEMPSFYRRMGRLHILTQFLCINLGLGFTFYFYPTSGFFRFTAWLLVVILFGMMVNNLKLPKNKGALLLKIFAVPGELALITLVLDWDWRFFLVEWVCIEMFGLFGGLVSGTLFKKADISILHRLISFVIALILSAAVMSGFYQAIRINYSLQPGWDWLLLIIPLLHSFYNNSAWFIAGEEKGTMNMGSSVLNERYTPLMAISAVVWFFLASVLTNLGPGL